MFPPPQKKRANQNKEQDTARRENTTCVTASLVAQQEFLQDVSRSGILLDFQRRSTSLLQPQLAAHSVVVCVRGRHDHLRSAVRCSSAQANVVSCATLLYVRFVIVAVAHLARRNARASTRAHRRTCAGPVTWKTFDDEAMTNLECLSI